MNKKATINDEMEIAIAKQLGFEKVAYFPQWQEDVRHGRTLLSFKEWLDRTQEREATFTIADIPGFNCDRKYVEKLLKGDDLMELTNRMGVRVFASKEHWADAMRFLNRGVQALYGSADE